MVLKRKSGCPDIEEFFLQIEAGNPSYLGVFFLKKKWKERAPGNSSSLL
jgi:hypothetical protein